MDWGIIGGCSDTSLRAMYRALRGLPFPENWELDLAPEIQNSEELTRQSRSELGLRADATSTDGGIAFRGSNACRERLLFGLLLPNSGNVLVANEHLLLEQV